MSKCDFRVDFSSRMEGLPKDLVSRMRFSIDPPLGPPAELTSSKCDWRLTIGSFQADGLRDRLQALKTQLRDGSLLRMSSDKCDWSIRVTPAASTASRQPAIAARMVADKCDFSTRVQFGIEKGTTFRVSATSSSKCDLSAGPLQVFDPRSGTWRPVDPGGHQRGGT